MARHWGAVTRVGESSEEVDIEFTHEVRSSARATLFAQANGDHTWIPDSMVLGRDDAGGAVTLRLPLWFARERGLE